MAKPLSNTGAAIFLFLISAVAILPISFLPIARAETAIISLSPSSGHVGTTIQLLANISTSGGEYRIMFDQDERAKGNATENTVIAFFSVPYTAEGGHNVTLIDVKTAESNTTTFTVSTFYSLETFPKLEPPAQFQEGDGVQFFLNITGGKRQGISVANVTVQTPTNASYTNLVNVTTSEDGSGNKSIAYPDEFPTGANTNFTGEYTVSFNTTLATKNFFVGIMNATEYHRYQTVYVKAIYAPNENVAFTITNVTSTTTGKNVTHLENLTANANGVVNSSWTIPPYAPLGIYTVNVTSISGTTIKNPVDVQNFTIPGHDVNATTRNLAGEPVQNVELRIFEDGNSIENRTSNVDGLTRVKLENGTYTTKAFYKGYEVGGSVLNVTESILWNISCSLTNIRAITMDNDGNRIPFVNVTIYSTVENITSNTRIDGNAEVHSLLSGLSYVLNTSRYNVTFNSTTIGQLPATDWLNITILIPTFVLNVNVTYRENQPLAAVTVAVQELIGGKIQQKTTVEDGTIAFTCNLGRYVVSILKDGVKLNETIVDLLLENKSVSIRCALYNLPIFIKVVDYFGQPIPNANVVLERGEAAIDSLSTGSDGIARFSENGGIFTIKISLPGQTQPTIAFTSSISEPRNETNPVEAKIEKYVVLAGFLVETGQLSASIILIASVIIVLFIEVYRKRRSKPPKSED